MPKTIYCAVPSCKHSVGVQSGEIQMFRFPTEKEQMKQWIEAINGSNNGKNKCSGIGMICNLHFQPNDIHKLKGRLQLKKGTIPTIFVSSIKNSNNSDCTNCKNMNLELATLKQNFLEAQIKFDIELFKKNDKIKHLENKNDDHSAKICDLKEEIYTLQKAAKENKVEVKKLQEQIMNVSNIEVNIPFPLFMIMIALNCSHVEFLNMLLWCKNIFNFFSAQR